MKNLNSYGNNCYTISKARVVFDREMFGQQWMEVSDLEIDDGIVKFSYLDSVRGNKPCKMITNINNVIIDFDEEI